MKLGHFQSDMPNWAFLQVLIQASKWTCLVQWFQGNRIKAKAKQMQEHGRTCLGAFMSQAGKQCFTLVHVLLLVRIENLLILPANPQPP